MSTKSFFDLILTARQNDPEALRTARALWSAHTAGCIEPPLLPTQAAVLEQVIGEDGMRQAIEEDPTYVYTTNLLVCRHRMLISFHDFQIIQRRISKPIRRHYPLVPELAPAAGPAPISC